MMIRSVSLLPMLALMFTTVAKSEDAVSKSLALNLAASITSIIQQDFRTQQVSALRATSLQMAKCSVLYNMSAKNPKYDGATAQKWVTVSEAYLQAAVFLYPDTSGLKSDLTSILPDVRLQIRDKKKLFYLLRNCQSLSEGPGVSAAITELLLD